MCMPVRLMRAYIHVRGRKAIQQREPEESWNNNTPPTRGETGKENEAKTKEKRRREKEKKK